MYDDTVTFVQKPSLATFRVSFILSCLFFKQIEQTQSPQQSIGGIFKGRKGRDEQRRPSNSDPVQKKNCSFFFQVPWPV